MFQVDCINYLLENDPVKKHIPTSNIGIRRKAWNLVTSSDFENFIMIVIAINALSFMLNVSLYFSHYYFFPIKNKKKHFQLILLIMKYQIIIIVNVPAVTNCNYTFVECYLLPAKQIGDL